MLHFLVMNHEWRLFNAKVVSCGPFLRILNTATFYVACNLFGLLITRHSLLIKDFCLLGLTPALMKGAGMERAEGDINSSFCRLGFPVGLEPNSQQITPTDEHRHACEAADVGRQICPGLQERKKKRIRDVFCILNRVLCVKRNKWNGI